MVTKIIPRVLFLKKKISLPPCHVSLRPHPSLLPPSLRIHTSAGLLYRVSVQTQPQTASDARPKL